MRLGMVITEFSGLGVDDVNGRKIFVGDVISTPYGRGIVNGFTESSVIVGVTTPQHLGLQTYDPKETEVVRWERNGK